MTTAGAERIFIDTNILVYASIAEAPLHQPALSRLQTYEQTGQELWISRQVLREYLSVLTRPQSFTAPIPITTLSDLIRALLSRFQVADETTQVTEQLLVLLNQITVGGRQVHDANIVATMQTYGIQQLLTHNVGDFTRFAAQIVVLPLLEPP
ncbi:type II toxin-antitoxin system VapC family toxin [Rivularia sp. UHCC 0363]|uniref:type II toxin-antitoxin system VapC family toxin n=1 Tax=Rivularia sp. UHCC 0363 TaxID=3110244 RepID=UPI002B1EB65F|nr:type II toxin-antitoxin system VapC family toxin [Rivularia sp. UHCC 0363]MEA5599328.1 type II toxin-antitoxin system VapC family toxin [Rivularia sp. UHCC 0363]